MDGCETNCNDDDLINAAYSFLERINLTKEYTNQLIIIVTRDSLSRVEYVFHHPGKMHFSSSRR